MLFDVKAKAKKIFLLLLFMPLAHVSASEPFLVPCATVEPVNGGLNDLYRFKFRSPVPQRPEHEFKWVGFGVSRGLKMTDGVLAVQSAAKKIQTAIVKYTKHEFVPKIEYNMTDPSLNNIEGSNLERWEVVDGHLEMDIVLPLLEEENYLMCPFTYGEFDGRFLKHEETPIVFDLNLREGVPSTSVVKTTTASVVTNFQNVTTPGMTRSTSPTGTASTTTKETTSSSATTTLRSMGLRIVAVVALLRRLC